MLRGRSRSLGKCFCEAHSSMCYSYKNLFSMYKDMYDEYKLVLGHGSHRTRRVIDDGVGGSVLVGLGGFLVVMVRNMLDEPYANDVGGHLAPRGISDPFQNLKKDVDL
ncbi:hypothetical protein L2E82_37191 [Cichorium intybus]|uniref:Uncharacterized protein n=1 Tax=Cichorium intybus TaxID=13427 RepID=A0ACB9AD33_CICIN|nr:hypothetical protein L2E82_37191 [Cichorium intybus]